jgi:adenylate cyclase
MPDSAPSQPRIPIPADYFRIIDRYERPMERRPKHATVAEIAAWLAGPAHRIERTAELFDEFCWRAVAAGIPLLRVTCHVGTIHPQFTGFSVQWWRELGLTTDVALLHEVRETPAFRNNTIRVVTELGETVRRRIESMTEFDFPVLHDLKEEGVTDYIAMPYQAAWGRRIAITYATDRPGGFTDAEIAELARLTELFGVHIVMHGRSRIARNLLGAYLGPRTGSRVLDGHIRRGEGEEIRVVIWLSDLRGFTERSDRLPGERMIAVLNAFFDAQARAIANHDGEILKFMGDGLLAIFPVEDVLLTGYAARNALEAAQEAVAAVRALAQDPLLAGEPPLDMVVALHIGPVVYGNIGASDRLDFTVIGPAVNLASRIETIAKQLGHNVVVSEELATAIEGRSLKPIGRHRLRGLMGEHALFTVADPVQPASGQPASGQPASGQPAPT